jgi:hypothetical protein
MKKYFSAIALLFVMVIPSLGQSKAVKEVKDALETLRLQMLEPTAGMLKSLSSSKLSYGHSSGKIENQEQFVQALESKNSDFTTLNFDEVDIQVVGKTATVRHILDADTHDNGKEPGHVKLKVLLVFVKEKGKWLLLARQAVKM